MRDESLIVRERFSWRERIDAIRAESVSTLLGGLLMHCDWSWISDPHPNILAVGDRTATDGLVSELRSASQAPELEHHCGGAPLTLPASAGRLILRDVEALSLGEQQALNDWLCSGVCRTQVVTTSAAALFGLVKNGEFLETLYYRLNIVYMDLTAASATMEPAA